MVTTNKNEHKLLLNSIQPSQQIPQRRWPLSFAMALVLCLLVFGVFAQAEFDTIIDSPPTEFESYGEIGSNTQVNLYPNGVLPIRYNIGPTWEPGDNIEINLLGGSIGDEQDRYGQLSTSSRWVRTTNVTVNLIEGNVWGDLDGTAGALITLSGATVHGELTVDDGSLAIISGGQITDGLLAYGGSSAHLSAGSIGSGQSVFSDGVGVRDGSVFLMSGGDVKGELVVSDSYANVTEGRVTGRLVVNDSGLIEIAGGVLGPIQEYANGTATLIGGEFQMDGMPIEGLGANTQTVDFPEDSVLTGVLSDGTPVILSNMGTLQDYFADEQIELRQAPVPASEPRHFDTAVDSIPSGLRNGQSLSIQPGAEVPANFTALPGSTVSIFGGEIGHGFEAAGASIIMTAGHIGELSTIYDGTILQMSGGVIGSNFEVATGGRLEVSGGTVEPVFVAHPESEVLFSGGKYTGWLTAESGSSFTIAGGDFRLDGTPIAALSAPGNQQQLNLPEFGVLSGTLSDGTPFAFGNANQLFAPGTLTLKSTDIPAAGPSIVRVPSDPVPNGLRSGQTLLLSDGGDLGDHFTANWSSIVRMSGGRIGHRFQTVGSFVNVTGGEIESINALYGSLVNIDGGTINYSASVGRGAILNVFNGGIAGTVYVTDGGRVNITGGNLGRYIYVRANSSLDIQGGIVGGDISLSQGGTLTLQGGETHGEIHATTGSRLNIRGGRLADGLFVAEGTVATLGGRDFRIDGEPIGDDSLYTVIPVDLPSGAVLSGVFDDGTPFAFTSSDGDLFSPGTLRVSTNPYRLPLASLSLPSTSSTPPVGLRPGEELTLDSGENVGDNFTAGWDSRLTVNGGEIGNNFEAVGTEVRLLEGAIGEDMDVLFGSVFTMEGGTIGDELHAHRGSIVNIAGGNIPEIIVHADSKVSITGGMVGKYLDDDFRPGHLTLEAGSELQVKGTDFLIDGMPVEGMEEGGSVVLDWDDRPHYYFSSLNARLTDGSPFAVYLSNLPYTYDFDWQYDGPSTIILTMSSASEVVPEPSSLALIAAMALAACGRRRRQYATSRSGNPR